ncbi:sialidase-3-like [Pundamilia nyererei]|uniref:exo-alpha-sialidase n=1 Tax=Pundamilia nyererei TaxID=303518 RepID=A0A3B4GFV4_9CICH|nr:PREDICTED: sialidase-3-like [Pundamilia nyererei]XP_005735509.1 PREDICTED: sialidase-3-like [Pundamilia nyererei]XP_005735510.1 PREDICTED: sialidase-3-like [Pundamilia nyererei]XP_013766875.1 PREDICTED: sialidase-3-like [Pundamilia nyererei]
MGNTSSKGDSGEEPPKTTLFEREPSGITYRIPALVYLRHCHTFLAFAEKRSSPCDNDAKIFVMRRGTLKEDGSMQWSSSQELSSVCLPNHRTMNPCPVYEKNTKTLYLFFICVWGTTTEAKQILTGKNKTRLCYVSSRDDGQTWSQVTDLTDSVIGEAIHKWATFAVGPGHGVQLENGRLIIPAYAYYIPYRCCSFPIPCTVYPRAMSVYSEDFGQTWHIGKMLRKKSCECEMAEIIDHEGRSHLYCNARNAGGHRCEALSENSGVYFDKPHMAPELVETRYGCQGSIIGFPAPEFVPNDDAESKACGTSLLSPDTQTWLLFMHPTSKSRRRDMGVYLNRSPLHSSGWDRPRIIHRGPSGYSDLAYNGDKDQFSCLMECGKESELEQIAFVSFSLNDVMQTGGRKEKR